MPLFLASQEVHGLVDWLLAHAADERVVLVPTAAAGLPDREEVVGLLATPLERAGIRPELVEVGDAEGASRLAGATAVVVSGGDPFALLAALRRGGGDELRRLVAAGVPYVGMSAGAMVAGPHLRPALLTSPFTPPEGLDLAGLCLVDRLVLPHHDRPGRAARHHEAALRHGREVHLVPLSDDEVLLDGARRVRLADGTEVRDAEVGDAPGLAEVFTAAARAAWAPFVGAERMAAWSSPASTWAERVGAAGDAGRTFRVAVDREGVCAFAAAGVAGDADLDRRVGELALFYAHPRAWGSGLAGRLHGRALVDLCARGFDEAVVWTEERNARALRVYEREGWRPDGAVRERTFLDVPIRERRLRRRLVGPG